MSIEYCEYCDEHIDTDFDAEHFETEDKDNRCINEEQDKTEIIKTENKLIRR